LGEPAGNGFAKSAAAAGDERGFASQVQEHRHSLP